MKSKNYLAIEVGKPIKDPKNPMRSKNSFALAQS
jgi:hypothetical protein